MANTSIYQNFLKPVRSAQEYANDEVTREQNLLGLQDSQIKIANARQAQADEIATRQAFAAGSGDLKKTIDELSIRGHGKAALSLMEQQRKLQDSDAGIKLKGAQTEQAQALTGQKRFTLSQDQQRAATMEFLQSKTPDEALQNVLRRVKSGELPEELALRAMANMPTTQAEFDVWRDQKRMGLLTPEQQLPKRESFNAGDAQVSRSVDPLGRIVPGTEQRTPIAESPNNAANNRELRQWRAAQTQQALTGAQGVAARTNYETNTIIPVPGLSSATAPQGQTGTTLDVNNPGGLRPVGASTGFQRFDTPEAGLQAVTQNLRAYGQKGINTIEKIVSTWAPSNENDTKAYIAHVSRMLGIPANQPLDMRNPYVLQGLTTAIITKEQGPRLFSQPQQQNLPSTQKARDALISDKAKGGEFGSPQEVTGPDGKPMLVVQNKRTGFMHDANNLQPVAVAGPKVDTATSKELTSINQQRATIDGALKAVKESPDAFSFSRGIATRLGPTAETIAGRSDTPAQSQARSYVFNIVSKVINERAGAAQSAQELARLRGFLPAEQDNAQQITNKLNGFKQFLDDLEKGTTGIRGATAKPEGDKPQGPKVGERRIISGMDAEWDGKGWKKVSK